MNTRGPIAMHIDSDEKEEFLTLTHKLKAKGTQLVGRIHLFDLERLREHFGDRWEHFADSVHGTFRSILKGHALSNIVFYPYDEHSYLVFSFRGSTKQAQLRSEEIRQEIVTKLLGSEASPELMEVYTWAYNAEGHTEFQPLGDAPPTSPPQTEEAVQFVYRPLLSVKDKTFSAYQCFPVRARGMIGFSAGYDVLSAPESPRDIAELDDLALEHASSELNRMAGTDAHVRIIVPVHFQTLTHAEQGQQYLQKCHHLFPTKTDTVSFELFGLPERLTEYNFGSLVWQLRSAAQQVFARVSIDHPNFIDLRVSGVQGVSADLYNDFRSERQLLERLDQFSDLAHQEDLLTYVSGIRTVSLNTAAICSGADFVGGYPVSGIYRAVKDLKTFDLDAQYPTAPNAAERKGEAPTP